MTLKEIEIQRTCSQFLELDGWRRLRTDPVSRREWGKGFGEKGMADDLFIRYGWAPSLIEGDLIGKLLCELMWIEWKRPKNQGGRTARHQHEWHMQERARGALTLKAGEDFPGSVEGFMEFYAKSGLQRRVMKVGPGA